MQPCGCGASAVPGGAPEYPWQTAAQCRQSYLPSDPTHTALAVSAARSMAVALGSGRWDALADSSASMLGLRNELCALRGLLGALGDERRLWDGVEALASPSGAHAVHNPTLWAPQLFEACVFVCLLAAASLAPPAALIAPAS